MKWRVLSFLPAVVLPLAAVSLTFAAAPLNAQVQATTGIIRGTTTESNGNPISADVPDADENPQMEAMMKQMLGDMTMSVKVVIEPGIAETDATYRDANTITLVDVAMAKLLEKPDTLKKLNSAPKDNPAAAMELLKGLEGVKMETNKQVTVKLK